MFIKSLINDISYCRVDLKGGGAPGQLLNIKTGCPPPPPLLNTHTLLSPCITTQHKHFLKSNGDIRTVSPFQDPPPPPPPQ